MSPPLRRRDCCPGESGRRFITRISRLPSMPRWIRWRPASTRPAACGPAGEGARRAAGLPERVLRSCPQGGTGPADRRRAAGSNPDHGRPDRPGLGGRPGRGHRQGGSAVRPAACLAAASRDGDSRDGRGCCPRTAEAASCRCGGLRADHLRRNSRMSWAPTCWPDEPCWHSPGCHGGQRRWHRNRGFPQQLFCGD